MKSQYYSQLPLGLCIALAISAVTTLNACSSDNDSDNTTQTGDGDDTTQTSDNLLRSDNYPGVTCQTVESETRDGIPYVSTCSQTVG